MTIGQMLFRFFVHLKPKKLHYCPKIYCHFVINCAIQKEHRWQSILENANRATMQKLCKYAMRGTAEALSAENLVTKTDAQEIKAILRLHQWMIGFNLAFTMNILWKVFG